ncbi:Mor transcription activator family protein [Thiothrix lacustris]|uniref:Mor transcription activator family protein n=1 Tax=Thiothrix lacustris TaxID=525917 RepID=UPI00048E3668|nr:Mor transcription activator family protein [Thiothrix lacustris]
MDNLLTTPDSSTARSKWPETLVQMLDGVHATLLRIGMDDERAAQVSLTIVHDHANNFGGCQYYLPKGDELKRALRDREIYRLAGKTDVAVLAQRYNLSMKQIWEIQRAQRTLHINKIQPSLF